jgi:acetyl coenzyme A synthetase (ADP forming)-like protein
MREDSVPALLDPTEEREWLADVAAVEGFLRPRTVAVVGASRRRGSIGGELFHNLLSYGFTGSVLPINPSTSSVQGVLAYPSIDAAPGPIDLAVIVVPAEAVLGVVEQCERKGIKHLVIISAGFGEAGPEGVRRQEALMKRCRAAGIRVIGPNCMGIVNTEAEVRLSATFAPTPPEPGRLAFMSQSGALGLAIMDYASRIGLGLSSFVSVGNKADISGNDLIRYWARDERVDVILLYLESFGNPRKFSRIARRVARAKPIVAVKSGRSPAGARAAGSHTGALIAASDTTVDALFRHAGVVRTDTLEEMFDVASLLAHQPVPKGRRVAIVTNAGGPGILCADACAAEGLEIAPLADDTRRALRALLPPAASVENPVDMIASAPADHFRETLRMVGRDDAVDAIIAIYVPPLVTGAEEVARAILDGGRSLGREKPLLTVFMQARGLPEGLSAPDIRIPSYAFPESAAIALARAARYGEWLSRPDVEPVRPDGLRRAEAESVIAHALARGDAWLDPEDVWRVLTAYGFPLVEQRVCVTAEEVSRAARGLGGVLALKAQSAGVLHKTEAGAVELKVPAAEAGSVARRMEARLRAAGRTPVSFTLQRMANPGLEMIVGAVHDPQFGPVLACGAGGTLVELLKDVSLRIAPVAVPDAREMLGELKTYPALTGYRGAPPRDVASLVDVIVRAGWLVDELPQIRELDLNPVMVHEEGATVVDARIRIGKDGA